MYSNPHPLEKIKQIFKNNLDFINNYTKIHDGKKINYQEKVKEILNDKNQYAALVKNIIRYQEKDNRTFKIRTYLRESIREAILDYVPSVENMGDEKEKYLKSDSKPIYEFLTCISRLDPHSDLRDKEYTDELNDELIKYIKDEINNKCDNKNLFDHKKENITKTVNWYTRKYSSTLFPEPLKPIIEEYVDNECPLTISNQ